VNFTKEALDWIVVRLQGVRARIQVLLPAKQPNSDRLVYEHNSFMTGLAEVEYTSTQTGSLADS
jgi:hypothetical protein